MRRTLGNVSASASKSEMTLGQFYPYFARKRIAIGRLVVPREVDLGQMPEQEINVSNPEMGALGSRLELKEG